MQQIYFRSPVKQGKVMTLPQMPEVVQWLHCVTNRLALKI